MKKILLATAASAVIAASSAYAETDSFYLKAQAGMSSFGDVKINHPELTGDKIKSKNTGFIGLGFGYHVMDNVRAELGFDHFFTPTAEIDAKNKVKVNANTLMLNGFVDLFEADKLKVFVGAGVGFGQLKTKLYSQTEAVEARDAMFMKMSDEEMAKRGELFVHNHRLNTDPAVLAYLDSGGEDSSGDKVLAIRNVQDIDIKLSYTFERNNGVTETDIVSPYSNNDYEGEYTHIRYIRAHNLAMTELEQAKSDLSKADGDAKDPFIIQVAQNEAIIKDSKERLEELGFEYHEAVEAGTPAQEVKTSLKEKTNIAFAGYVGVAYEIADGVNAELTYSYKHMGEIAKAESGQTMPKLQSHNVGIGVRFDM